MLKEVPPQSSGLGLDNAPILLEFRNFVGEIVGFHDALYILFCSRLAFTMKWYNVRNVLILSDIFLFSRIRKRLIKLVII